MTEKEIGVTDEPVKAKDNEADKLNIGSYIGALKTFIKNTKTPITIGIQGSWRTGKTSLLNILQHSFDQNKKYKQIWINAWEYTLLSAPEETLVKIIRQIIFELDPTDSKRILKKASGIFKGALRIGASATLGAGAAEVIKEIGEGDNESQSISTLRQELSTLLETKVSSENISKFIVYVDDLDRIEPKNAVAILELLKNIFNIPHCVFLLAIDYDVVVKGLEHKFGKRTAENEYEFRSFFDKIIQLPFKMPTGDYDLVDYINSLVKEIEFCDDDLLDDDDVEKIVMNTIGGNPRSLKRLANSLTLLKYFSQSKSNDEEKQSDGALNIENESQGIDAKKLLFSILCLQIEFPDIYQALARRADIWKWDNKFAYDRTGGAELRIGEGPNSDMTRAEENFYSEFQSVTGQKLEVLKDEDFKGLDEKVNRDFNEKWELVLFKICYPRPRYRGKVIEISRFISHLFEKVLTDNENKKKIAKLEDVLRATSITSVATEGTVAQAKNSKVLNEDQYQSLEVDKADFIASLKKNGSVFSRMPQKGASISATLSFKKEDFPKEIQEKEFIKQLYNKPLDLKQRAWFAYFYKNVGVSIYAKGDDFKRFMHFCEKQIPDLNERSKSINGTWHVIPKNQNNVLQFEATPETILTGEAATMNWNKLRPYIAINKQFKDAAVNWLSNAAPFFENEFIQICKKYMDSVGDEI